MERLHPRLAGFAHFFETELAPFLAAQEHARRAAVRRLVRVAGVTLPIATAALALPWMLELYPDPELGLFATFAGAMAALAVIGHGARDLAGVAQRVKHELASRICGFAGMRYRARPQAVRVGWFGELGLVPDHDRAHLEDEIAADLDGVSFQLCEAHLEARRTRPDARGRMRTRYVTVFRGVLGCFTFQKPFRGRTIIRRDGGVLGNFLGSLGAAGERVRLEDPRFEALFEVRSSDQVEARYLLTPAFMERLMALAEMVEGALQLAFDRGRLLLAVNGGPDRFEIGAGFSDVADPALAARMAAEIALGLRIAEALKLDAATRA